MDEGDTGDFAVVGVLGGKIFLEANEWDKSANIYRVVTLYLDPGHALRLADQLTACVAGADVADGGMH